MLATVLITGVPLWAVDYATYTNQQIVGFISLILLFVCGIAMRLILGFKVSRTIKISVIALAMALIVKIIIDTSINATDHNLFPFELLFAAAAALIVALLAIAISALIKALFLGASR